MVGLQAIVVNGVVHSVGYLIYHVVLLNDVFI